MKIFDKCKYKKIIIAKVPHILENLNNLFKKIAEFQEEFFYNFDLKIITKDDREFILLRSHDYYNIYEFEYLFESQIIEYIMNSVNIIINLLEKENISFYYYLVKFNII